MRAAQLIRCFAGLAVLRELRLGAEVVADVARRLCTM